MKLKAGQVWEWLPNKEKRFQHEIYEIKAIVGAKVQYTYKTQWNKYNGEEKYETLEGFIEEIDVGSVRLNIYETWKLMMELENDKKRTENTK